MSESTVPAPLEVSRSELANLVEHWRKILLPEWRVHLKSEPPPHSTDENEYWAICETKEDYRSLVVFFTDEGLRRPVEDVEITVVHELIHALTRPWRQQVNSLAGELSSAAYSNLREARQHEEEELVDRLSRVLVAQTHGRSALPPFGTISDHVEWDT